MISTSAAVRVFICTTPCDMRRSFDGLVAMTKDVIREDPFSGHLFVFRNRKGHLVKVLWWDRSGFALFYKRLEKGVFNFPGSNDGHVEVEAAELALMLEGIDLKGARRRPRFEPAAARTSI